MIKGSLWKRTLPYFSMAVRAVTEIESCTKPVMNQATQCTALFKPIIFITCGKINFNVNHGTTLELSQKFVTPVRSKRKFSLFSHLFQSLLLLCYDVLDHHGYWVDPGYDHTQRHHVLDNKQKTANGKKWLILIPNASTCTVLHQSITSINLENENNILFIMDVLYWPKSNSKYIYNVTIHGWAGFFSRILAVWQTRIMFFPWLSLYIFLNDSDIED